MDDPSHIAFVNAHPEGYRCTHHLDPIVDKIILCPFTGQRSQTGMIGRCRNGKTLQVGSQHLGIIPLHAIDDARLMVVLTDETNNIRQFLPLAQSLTHFKREVGPIERGDEDLWIDQVQLLQNVLTRRLVGRSRQSHNRHLREALLENSQLGIFRAKVVPPLRDTVCLIDGNQ